MMRSLLLLAGLSLGWGFAAAQDVPEDRPIRRAIPVTPSPDELPVRRAEPVTPPAETRPALPVLRAEPATRPLPTPAEPPPLPPQPEQRDPAASDTETILRLAPETSERSTAPDVVMFNVANGFYGRKIYEIAATEFARFLQIHPGSTLRDAAWFRLGESYRAMDDKPRAQLAYESLLREKRDGEFVGSAAYRLAEMAVERDAFASALGYFEQATLHVKDQQVKLASMFREARCLEILRRRESARQVYRRVLESDTDPNPYREAALLAVAQISMDTGRKREAAEAFDELASTTKKPAVRAEAMVNAALALVDLGESEAAADRFRKVLGSPAGTDWPQIARVGLMRIDYDAERFENVLKSYELDPGGFTEALKPEAMLLAANSLRQLERGAEAAVMYGEVAGRFGDTPFAAEAAFQQLVSLYSSGSPELLERIEQFLDTTGSSLQADQARLLKAETLFRDEKWADASGEYRQLVKSALSEDRRANAAYKLGWCLLQTGDHESALEAFTDYLVAFDGQNEEATVLAQRGLLFQRLTQYNEATADFDQLISQFTQAPEREIALQQKALILGQRGDNEGMMQIFQILLDDYPETDAAAQANYWIGWVHFENQRYSDALPALKSARDMDPANYGERAGLRIILSHYYLEDRDGVTAAINTFHEGNHTTIVPAEVLRWTGISFFQDGDAARATEYLGQLTGRENPQPPPADVFLTLGRAWQALGNLELATEAIASYLKATDDPSLRAEAILVRARAEIEAAAYEAAAASIDETLQLQPEGKINAEARILEAELAFARNEFEAAAKAFERVAVLFWDPEVSPRALARAYTAWSRSANTEQAERVLNDLKTRFPEYPLSEE